MFLIVRKVYEKPGERVLRYHLLYCPSSPLSVITINAYEEQKYRSPEGKGTGRMILLSPFFFPLMA